MEAPRIRTATASYGEGQKEVNLILQDEPAVQACEGGYEIAHWCHTGLVKKPWTRDRHKRRRFYCPGCDTMFFVKDERSDLWA